MIIIRILITSCLLIFLEVATCQINNIDSTSFYISKLNWDSFSESGDHFPNLYLMGDAKKILEIKDKHKIRKLVNCIQDSEKTVAIHIILTKLLEPQKANLNNHFHYKTDGSMQMVEFEYNSLMWSTRDVGNYQISQSEIKKIK